MNSLKNIFKNTFILALLVIVVLQSCKKELEINADYKAFPVIYGFLNPYDSLQIIKINKSFLGNENPNNYAGIQDSALFDQVDVRLVELHNGQERESYPLQKIVLNNKESGVFSGPENVVYVAALPRAPSASGVESIKFLNESSYSGGVIENRVTYRLEGTLNNSIEIKAETTSIPEQPADIFTQTPFRNLWRTNAPKGNVKFATSSGFTKGLLFDVKLPPFVKIADIKMIFHYLDIKLDGTQDTNTIESGMGQYVSAKVNENNTIDAEFFIGSERFFELIKISVPDFDETTLKERKPYYVDFEIVMADEEYYFYRENTLPSDDLNQLKPQYTNIENGFGIFASRLKMRMTEWAIGTNPDINSLKVMKGVLLDKNTQIALNRGFIITSDGETIELGTKSKRFCTDSEVTGSISTNCN